jgi:phospholipid/cholesterol/gamma-HCH transport system substrate-binding protein
MEREANYAAVGAFVLLVLAMAGAFVYWYADSRDARDYTRYEVYFDGSVSGLTEGGAVRYLGVDIGRVVRLRLDRRAADRVQVIVDIDSTTPVSERTLAQLSLQGVTGLLYIDLLLEPEKSPFQRVLSVPGENYPVIRSVRSNFDTFVSSLPDMTARLGEVAARANAVLSDDNIAAFSRLMVNLDKAGSTLPGTLTDAGALVSDLRVAAADATRMIAQLRAASDSAAPDLAAAMQRLRVTSDNMANASEKLDAMIAENRGDLRGFVRDGLPQFEALVRDARDAAREFQLFSRSLRENPSQILYERPAAGVEIPR